MKLFKCNHCRQLLYFENNRCEQCRYPLGFIANKLQLVPLVPQDNETFKIYNTESGLYRYCANFRYGVCNWLVPAESKFLYCEACALNHTIPDLSKPEYLERWKVLETAKHRLVYTLLRLKLPFLYKSQDWKRGLSFDFLADENRNSSSKILTGHSNGLITINIAEADDIEREMARKAMREPYRTVLGHFRHEIAHYYWDLLIMHSDKLEGFRQLFGDESQNYGEALARHYQQGPPPQWYSQFISSYASSHPWEDWAETWAHYLHIIDTLETAYAFGLSVRPTLVETAASMTAEVNVDPYEIENFNTLISLWLPLSFAMNSLNRSMGHKDLYPFIIPPKVMEKLNFIHQICHSSHMVDMHSTEENH
jgi:hypothetical protein